MTPADKPAFLQAIARLAVGLREKEPDAVQMRVYFDALREFDIEFVALAAERLLKEATWFPKVSEWRAAVLKVAADRRLAQEALMRKCPSYLCDACSDTGWAETADRRVQRCSCQEQRRLERLGRQPWPALPTTTDTAAPSGPLTDTESRAALASLERRATMTRPRPMPDDDGSQ